MKAILVIEMPNECWECPMHIDGVDDENEEIMVCKAKARESDYGKRPKWCPLKPMPQKNKYDVDKYATVDYENNITLGHYLNIGWNACIDEILGEEK